MASVESTTETRPAQVKREQAPERAAAFFESVLWESEVGARMRQRLVGLGLEESTLRTFRVGLRTGQYRAAARAPEAVGVFRR